MRWPQMSTALRLRSPTLARETLPIYLSTYLSSVICQSSTYLPVIYLPIDMVPLISAPHRAPGTLHRFIRDLATWGFWGNLPPAQPGGVGGASLESALKLCWAGPGAELRPGQGSYVGGASLDSALKRCWAGPGAELRPGRGFTGVGPEAELGGPGGGASSGAGLRRAGRGLVRSSGAARAHAHRCAAQGAVRGAGVRRGVGRQDDVPCDPEAAAEARGVGQRLPAPAGDSQPSGVRPGRPWAGVCGRGLGRWRRVWEGAGCPAGA